MSSPNRPRYDYDPNSVVGTNSDQVTSAAFSTSWNSLPAGSVYAYDQFRDWLKDSRIDPFSTYILMRNGNSWNFGGRLYESIAG